MAEIITSTVIVPTGPGRTVSSGGLTIAPTGSLVAEDGNGVEIPSGIGGASVQVAGSIVSSGDGVVSGAPNPGTSLSYANTVQVTGTGQILAAGAGVQLVGSSASLLNAGLISGFFGVWSGYFLTNFATDHSIVNSGTLQGLEAGIAMYQTSGTITNSGLIQCSSYFLSWG